MFPSSALKIQSWSISRLHQEVTAKLKVIKQVIHLWTHLPSQSWTQAGQQMQELKDVQTTQPILKWDREIDVAFINPSMLRKRGVLSSRKSTNWGKLRSVYAPLKWLASIVRTKSRLSSANLKAIWRHKTWRMRLKGSALRTSVAITIGKSARLWTTFTIVWVKLTPMNHLTILRWQSSRKNWEKSKTVKNISTSRRNASMSGVTWSHLRQIKTHLRARM